MFCKSHRTALEDTVLEPTAFVSNLFVPRHVCSWIWLWFWFADCNITIILYIHLMRIYSQGSHIGAPYRGALYIGRPLY